MTKEALLKKLSEVQNDPKERTKVENELRALIDAEKRGVLPEVIVAEPVTTESSVEEAVVVEKPKKRRRRRTRAEIEASKE